MKRGKDDETSFGPMFPRLHVNDTTEKGGPRAPPRNKMALYEQLSIPSQRLGSSGGTPLNTQNKPNLASSVSSSQGSGVERHSSFPSHLHQSSLKLHSHHSHGPDETPMALEQQKKLRDEHEFTVPVFLKSRIGQSHDMDSVSSISSALSGGPMGEKNAPVTVITKNNASFKDPPRNESEENADGRSREAKESADQERRGHDSSNFGRPRDAVEACLDQERGFDRGDNVVESSRDKQRSEPRRVEDRSRHNRNGFGVAGFISLQPERVEKGCDISEASMLESISGLDIAPDDVVGVIGQKHFWKARKAIVNQQRVFSVQVFELHRLIKVQKLIAESPHLLLEDGAFLRKSSFKCSPVDKTPLKFTVKPLPTDVPDKPSHKRTEHSAENVFGKSPLSSVNPPPVVTTTDNNNTNNKADPWCFHQSPGPQWLVPVMSPSEGLVYKPYPGPGLPGSVYGPPFGSAPPMGSFGNSPYGVQAPNLPATSPAGHAYFPPYGMAYPNPDTSVSAGEQLNQFSHSQTGPAPAPVPGPGFSLNAEQQSSCNVPKPPQKNGSITESQVHKFRASRGSDLQQGSTASSPGERRDPLPLFPVGPAASEEGSRSHVAEQPTRAIRVVPHSRRSATESAARIFRFIQEERKQFNYS